jgi:hypothetical protein
VVPLRYLISNSKPRYLASTSHHPSWLRIGSSARPSNGVPSCAWMRLIVALLIPSNQPSSFPQNPQVSAPRPTAGFLQMQRLFCVYRVSKWVLYTCMCQRSPTSFCSKMAHLVSFISVHGMQRQIFEKSPWRVQLHLSSRKRSGWQSSQCEMIIMEQSI